MKIEKGNEQYVASLARCKQNKWDIQHIADNEVVGCSFAISERKMKGIMQRIMQNQQFREVEDE